MTSDHLLDHVQAFLIEQCLMQPEICLVVAVSGGPDSLCLLHVLWRLWQMGGPALHVAHLDHGFRAAESAAEAEVVARIATELGLSATIERQDIPAISKALRQNKQATARAMRYAFLADIALVRQCAAVAVGHQANDQAETVLLHLVHGAGPAGLRGMRPVVPWEEWRAWLPEHDPAWQDATCANPCLIRPLLHATRTDIETYCTTHTLQPCRDPSNQLPHYTRNRIRMELLPHMESYNQQMVTALQRTARICADDYAYIQAQLDTFWPKLVDSYPGMVQFYTHRWAQLPATLQRYALRRAALHLVGSDAFSFDQIEAGRHAAAQGTGYQHTLGRGIWLYVTYDSFLLTNQPVAAAGLTLISGRHNFPQLAVEELSIAVPGITPISATWQIETGYTAPENPGVEQNWRWSVRLNVDALDEPLVMRRRRAGDRFRPAGGSGSRRLQDFFVDHKLPRDVRAAWPILATASQIVWVAGMRADARFHANADSRHVLWVTLTRT